MKVFEYLDRISLVHKLVSERSTGTPAEFARRLGIGRTCLYELIDELRSRGAPIVYSKSAKTFYYSEPFDIKIICSFKLLSTSEMENFCGGINLYSRVLFFRTVINEICQIS
jgi:predicted DNA-binding transcriptional regulator YafY